MVSRLNVFVKSTKSENKKIFKFNQNRHMMINGVGVDIESTKKFKNVSSEFLNLVFTLKEIEYCKKKKEPHICFAGKFCAKEAVIKSFSKKIFIKDIEIINEEEGKPQVYIKREFKKNIQCSISHTNEYAIAYVINEMSNNG